MPTTHWRRALVAVIITTTCLATMSSPASAAVISGEVSAWDFAYSTPGYDHDLNSPTNCPSPTYMKFDIETVSTNTVRVADIDLRDRYPDPLNPTVLYLVVLTDSYAPLNVPGTYGSGVISNMRVGILLSWYSSFDPITCTPIGTAFCNIGVQLSFTGTYTGSLAPGLGATALLLGNSVGTTFGNPTCSGPQSILLNNTITTTHPLTVQLS